MKSPSGPALHTATQTKILVIDDHDIVRESVRLRVQRFPDLKVVGEAEDTDEGWRMMVELEPDLVILDLVLPSIGGIAMAKRIHEAYPGTRILVLSARTESAAVNAALRAGANGYLLKIDAGVEIIDAVRTVLSGELYLCPRTSAVIAAEFKKGLRGGAKNRGVLSDRELEVLKMIANGLTTKEMALELKVSTKTIETHRVHLLAKLGLNGVAALTKYAVREGLSDL